MNVHLSKLHDKFMRHELVQNPDFAKFVTEESISGDQWILRLSYTDQNHAITEDHFDIQVIDHHPLPHVICGLTRFNQNDGPRIDTRQALFKPGKWLGPELVVNPLQNKSPLPSSVRNLERPSPTTGSTTQNPREDGRLDPRSTSTLTQSKLAYKPDLQTTPASIGSSKNNKRENSVEYGILTIVKAFVKGTQILVSKPKDSPRKRLATVRRCFRTAIETNPSGPNVPLIDKWGKWRDQNVPVDDVYSKTDSHITKLETDVGSTRNVATYIAGVRDFYGPRKTDSPPLTVRQNRPRLNLELGFDRIMNLTKALTAYYEGDTDIAMSIFTFLEVGGFGFTKLGCIAKESGQFLHDGILALVDLVLRRLAAKNTATGEKTIPLLNPVAFQWWYGRQNGSYEDMCRRFELLAISSASPMMCVEKPVTLILDKIRQRSQSLTGLNAEHEKVRDVEDTNQATGTDPPDKSKEFLIHNASRLAMYMSFQGRDAYVESFKGDDDEQANMKLAWKILSEEALTDELLTTSLDVAYFIIDILLSSPPKTQRVSKLSVKRKRALEPEADPETGLDASVPQNSPQVLPSSPFVLDNNTRDHHMQLEENNITFENQGFTGMWTDWDFTQDMAAGATLPDFLRNQAVHPAGTSSHFSQTIDPSQSDSLFAPPYCPGADFGGMNASDGLEQFNPQLFGINDWAGTPDFASDEFSQYNLLG